MSVRYGPLFGLLMLTAIPPGLEAQLLSMISGHDKTVTTVAYSPDGRWVASGSWDQSVRIWDAATFEPAAALAGHEGAITSIVYSPDGSRVFSGSRDHSIRVWDTRTHEAIATIVGHGGPVSAVACDPAGDYIVSGSEDQTLKIWDAATYKLRHTLSGHTGIVYSVAVRPDGEAVASGAWDGAVNVWNPRTARLKKSLDGLLSVVHAVAFSADGNLIIGGRGDGTINIWNARTYQLLETLKGHSGTVTSVCSHPGGGHLISGHGDGSINVWNAGTYQLTRTLNGHSGIVTSVAASAGGEEIASASGDYLVGVWDFFPLVADRRFPPDLFAELSFSEENGNGYLDADEVANLRLKLENKGRGDALNLKLMMTLAGENPHLEFENRALKHLKSGQSRSFDVALAAGLEVVTQPNVLRIEVTEQQGYDVDPVEFAFSTQSLKLPGFALLGVEIDDDDRGASFGRNVDGTIEPGEQIEARITLQNQGGQANPGAAREVEVRLVNSSEFIHVHSDTVFYRNRVGLGEVFAFDVIFAVLKGYPRSDRLLPLALDIREKYGIASQAGLSLGIELGTKSRPEPPLVVTPKPARLARARFARLGSRTRVVIETPEAIEPAADPLVGLPAPRSGSPGALAIVIGMPGVAKATTDAALMKTFFERVLRIPAADVKLFSAGVSRNELVTLFAQKLASAVDSRTDLYLFYSGGAVVDADGDSYLVPEDGSNTRHLVPQTCYRVEDLYAALSGLRVRSRTIILDLRVPLAAAQTVPLPSGTTGELDSPTTVISCIWPDSYDLTAPEGAHSPFVREFAVGLRGGADDDGDGKITLAEIRDYVGEHLSADNGAGPAATFWTSDGDYERLFARVAGEE